MFGFVDHLQLLHRRNERLEQYVAAQTARLNIGVRHPGLTLHDAVTKILDDVVILTTVYERNLTELDRVREELRFMSKYARLLEEQE